MVFRLNPFSGVPVYLQLMEQVKHGVETGALRPGDQLPTLRRLAEDLAVNPNTVVRAYRELQHDGVIELRHGSGAYIQESRSATGRVTRRTRAIMQSAIERLIEAGLTDEEIRRLFENELASARTATAREKHHG